MRALALILVIAMAAACSSRTSAPELVWEADGEVRIHLAVQNHSDDQAPVTMDIRLAEQPVAQGAFAGKPGNPHPPVHRYEFSAEPEADHLTVTSGGGEWSTCRPHLGDLRRAVDCSCTPQTGTYHHVRQRPWSG